MTRPNFFCGIDALNKLLGMEFKGEYKDIDLTMDFIELPYLFILNSDKENWNFKIIKRSDVYMHNGEGILEGELVVNKKSGTGEAKVSAQIGDKVNIFFEACRMLSKYIQENNLETVYEGFDPEEKGILLYLEEEQLKHKVVEGKERPDLMVDSLFSGMVMGRPYMDDFMENSMIEMMSLEEKIEAAEEGDIACMESLAMIYLNGDEVDKDPEKAVYWFQKLAEAGESNGMFNLGLHYAKGFGVERNFKKAAYWMEKAADDGDSDAIQIVPMYKTLAEKYDKAKAGDVEAMVKVSKELMMLGGSLEQAGANKDYEECVEFATKAVEQDNSEACWVLALCYEHGRGVEEDKTKAVEYYKLGADRGNASCMQNLGVCYLNGSGVPQDQTTGFEWELKAAELGNALAMRTVGQCYQFGFGCDDNMATAIEWYEKSLAIEYDEELASKVMVFKSIANVDADFEGYNLGSDGLKDSDPMPEFEIDLTYTKTGPRKERSNKIHVGDKVTFKLSADGGRIEAHTALGDVGDISSDATMLKRIVEKHIPYEAEISELVSYDQLENKRKNPTIVVSMRFNMTCGEVCKKTGLKYITSSIYGYYEWGEDSSFNELSDDSEELEPDFEEEPIINEPVPSKTPRKPMIIKEYEYTKWMKGKIFVLTGISDGYEGNDKTRITSLIESAGGIIKSSTVLDTNYLIYDPDKGGEDTTKYQRAKELISTKGKNIEIMTLSQFDKKVHDKKNGVEIEREVGSVFCLLEGDQTKCWVQKLEVVYSSLPLEQAKLVFEVYNIARGEYAMAKANNNDTSYSGLYGLDDEILAAREKIKDATDIPTKFLKIKNDEEAPEWSIRSVLNSNPSRYSEVKTYFEYAMEGGNMDFVICPIKRETYYWIDLCRVSKKEYERYTSRLNHIYDVVELFDPTDMPFDLKNPETVTIFGTGKFEAFADLSYGC